MKKPDFFRICFVSVRQQKRELVKKTSSLWTFYWTSAAKLTIQQQQRPHCRNVQTD